MKAAKGEHLGIVEDRKIRFEDYSTEYLKWSKANKTASTYVRDENTTDARLKPFFKGKYLGSITVKHLEDYKTYRAGLVKPRTVNRELDILKSMFARATEWGYIKVNPGREVKKLKFQKRPPTYLILEELGKLLEACEDECLYTFIVLGAFTGLRKEELLRLKWEDVNFTRREVVVQDAKNNEFRTVPMNQLVFDTLKRHPRHISGEVVLARPDGKPYRDLRQSFEKALNRAELKRIRIHDLRHSFASNLVAGGSGLPVVMELMGHKDIQTTMIYAHLAPDARQAAVDSLIQDGHDLDTGENKGTKKAHAS